MLISSSSVCPRTLRLRSVSHRNTGNTESASHNHIKHCWSFRYYLCTTKPYRITLIRTTPPTLQELYSSRESKRAVKITLDPHISTSLFELLRLVDATELHTTLLYNYTLINLTHIPSLPFNLHIIYLYIQLSVCIVLFLIYLFYFLFFFVLSVFIVVSLSFCCTVKASVTKTNSSYV